MGRRRLGREIAFKALYRIDLLGLAIEDAIADVEKLDRDAESRRFAQDLLESIGAERTAVDAALEGASDRFGPDRMGVVDRSILRLGATEILFWRWTPDRVSIDEWVEIARKYGSDEAYALVNAVLDRISREKETPGVDA